MGQTANRPQTTRAVTQGVVRLLAAWNVASVVEVALANGRRADVVGIGAKGEIWIVEVKSSAPDYLSDGKWAEYGDYCDRFFFAVAPDFPLELLPEGPGVIVADAFDGAFLREAPETALPGARRKAMLVLLARLAAQRTPA